MRLFDAPLGDVGLQAVVQGFLTAVASLLLYSRAVELFGASRAAAFETRLRNAGIDVAIRDGRLRISPSYYNDRTDSNA